MGKSVLILVFAAQAAFSATDSQRVLWEKTKAAFEHRDFNDCVSYATDLLKTHPAEASPIYYKRAAAYSKLGRYDEAIADFDEALRLNSRFVSAYIDRGLSYYEKGLFQQAASDFNRAIQLDPRNARAYRDRADLEDDMFLRDEALRDYNTALRLRPDYEEALYNRGNHYAFVRHDDSKAIADYTRCLSLNPANTDAKHNRAGCYRKQGQTGRALADFSDIIKHNPQDICAYMARAETYLKQHDRAAAMEDAKRAMDLAAKDDEGFRCRASAALLLGQYSAASRDRKAACERDRSSPAYLNSYAWLLATCIESGVRNGKEAVMLATQACVMTGWRAPSYVDTLAAAYAETGDFEQAVKYEELALSLSKKKWERVELRLRMFRERKPYRSENDK